CCSEVPITDITMRDAKSYCAILYQDNNRKPLARLFFDRKIPRIGIFNEGREMEVFDLTAIEDIYKHADLLRERCRALRDSQTYRNQPTKYPKGSHASVTQN